MRAVRLTESGLGLEQIDTPEPGAGDALVRVRAAAITKGELEWPVDRLPAIPSYELSGEVAALGPDANGVAVGDEVYALADFGRDGAAADFTVVAAALLAPKPRSLDHVASAAIPLAALTAWQGLLDHGRLEAGQRVLILGATGGVGHVATQLARHRSAHVIAAASDADAAKALGAHEVVDARRERIEDAIEPVDLVFDTVGGELLERAPAVVRAGGRLVSVATEPAPPGIYFVVEPNREQLERITRLVDDGELRPEIDSVYPLEESRAAFERSLAPGKRGKVVLRVSNSRRTTSRASGRSTATTTTEIHGGTAVLGRLSWQVAEVIDVVEETPRVKTIAFDVPGWPGHRAGQHVDVRLTAEDGYQAQRSYSIASPPDGTRVELTVERLEDGEVSPYLTDELRAGDQIELRGPVGGYFVWEPPQGGPLLLVAGGSGVAPLMAMIRLRAAVGSDADTRLLFSSRSWEDVIYREELERLEGGGLRVVHTLTRSPPADWTGYARRVDAEILAEVGPGPTERPRVYICGPTLFVEAVAQALVQLGHEPHMVKTERFGPTGG